MKNLLALAAAALLVFAAVGWYLGWYQIKSESKDGHRQIHIDVNGPKISEDLEKGKDKIRDLLTSKEKEAKAVTPPGASTPALPLPPLQSPAVPLPPLPN